MGLLVCGIVALAVAVWDLTGGGFYIRIFGVRVSSSDAFKPFRIAVLAMTAVLWLHDRTAEPDHASWHQLARAAPWVAAGAAIGCTAVAFHFGIFAAGGADGYGYVSQAQLWASGKLMVADRLAPLTPVLGRAVAPLGYELARTPGWLIPIYSPGLPMMMALAMALAGPTAVYVVVPLLAGATVWLTYLLARRTADERTALLASALLAFSPIFLFQSLEP
ncbi:MAG: glycosyltransferase family 39 protein, partial [Bryobacteraceae bacterium]